MDDQQDVMGSSSHNRRAHNLAALSQQSPSSAEPPPDSAFELVAGELGPRDGDIENGDSSKLTDRPHCAKASDLEEKFLEKKYKIKAKTKPCGRFDATSFPDAPQGYTVKFVFQKATNLPVADLQSQAADPYLVATLITDTPKRHKEDPPLVHRTRTVPKTTEPQWEDEWIVANVPASGFTLECRLYDQDWLDHDDRLGKVTVRVSHVDESWIGLGSGGQKFEVKKRSGCKRAYFLRGIASALSADVSTTSHLHIICQVLGKSDPPHAQIYTVGPTTWVKHYSPMIGRLTGIKVNRDNTKEGMASSHPKGEEAQKYDFQANEIQLSGPVPPKLYHRYVEFRPVIGVMFSSSGIRGRILNKALHHQHKRIYNFDSTTEHGSFEAGSEGASLQLLKMGHFDEMGRIFTYVLTLDGLLRFTETGRKFGIDLLSKHTMHSNVATYIAFSGEFFIRRTKHGDSSEDVEPTQPESQISGGAPAARPSQNPRHYQLIIDNDSGTYRPDKSALPDLKALLERSFPGLGIVAMHWEDEKLQKLKKRQLSVKKKEGRMISMVIHRSQSSSSLSLDDVERLDDLDIDEGNYQVKMEKQKGPDALIESKRAKDIPGGMSGEVL